MARRKSTTSNGKAMTSWDEELAQYAKIAAAAEEADTGGQFFSTAGGVLSWNDSPFDNNQMGVIILDSIFENIYFEEEYDPHNIQPPTCFAFARERNMLKPHPSVVALEQDQCSECAGCGWNEFASAKRGRGKACRNTRRLALISAGEFDRKGEIFEMEDDPDELLSYPIGFMRLPVTSVKGYANYVTQLQKALNRPPFGVITRIRVVPDPRNQFVVTFDVLDRVPSELGEAVMQRKQDAENTIEFPYSLTRQVAAPEKPKRGRRKKY